MNAAGAGIVHGGMSNAHPIAVTADTRGTLYLTGLADDPVEIITYKDGPEFAAWLDGMDGLTGNGPTERDAADVLRERLLNGIRHPKEMLSLLSEHAGRVATEEDPAIDEIDRVVATAKEQAYRAGARILFAAKQVAQYEATEHAARREAAYKAGQS